MATTHSATGGETTKPGPKVYSSPLLSLAIVGGFGLLLFLFSAGKTLLDHFYRTDGREIVATVTWCGYTSSSNSRSVRYTFTLPDGRSFRGSQTGYGGTVGETILVFYLPSNPSFNRVAGSERRGQKWLPFLAIAGLFFMFAGVHSYRVLRRQL
jgi:nitrate reductase NapE component